MRTFERLSFITLGFFFGCLTFCNLGVAPPGHVDVSLKKLKEPEYVVVGYNPDMKDLWRMDYGSKNGSGSWTVVTFKTKEEAAAAHNYLCHPPSNDKGK